MRCALLEFGSIEASRVPNLGDEPRVYPAGPF
jgi:hypothetical protein